MEPASAPNASDRPARTISIMPYSVISLISCPPLMRLTISAVKKGMMHSMTTSSDTKIGVRMDTFLYSRMLFAISLIIAVSFLRLGFVSQT